ncbi:MAG: hypothetical protein M1831_000249 [Alyxoria varia]|nr:MAG: hypothetical protein M1831_000249 [Alyxoria varia]
MRSVVFKEPKVVRVEQRPQPQIQDGKDVICKVNNTALCGSELHVFRGHQPSPTGFIMGHEFTGVIEQVGEDVKKFKPGDKVVSPFTLSCGECFYCENGVSSRCAHSQLYGTAGLEGSQAEYVRCPLADTTLFLAPPSVPEHLLVLMADIFPTGFFGARNAFQHMTLEQAASSTCVVIGCGPVGLCALVNALDYHPRNIFAVDSIPSRLALAQSLGATPLNFNDAGGTDGVIRRIKEVTDGRGADAIIEVVGLSNALRLAFDALRNWGTLSSIGVHNGEIPWSAKEGYDKNIRVQMGRCPVRSIFPDALKQLEKKHPLLGFMADKVMPLSQAEEGYELFDSMKVQKVVFEADK